MALMDHLENSRFMRFLTIVMKIHPHFSRSKNGHSSLCQEMALKPNFSNSSKPKCTRFDPIGMLFFVAHFSYLLSLSCLSLIHAPTSKYGPQKIAISCKNAFMVLFLVARPTRTFESPQSEYWMTTDPEMIRFRRKSFAKCPMYSLAYIRSPQEP